MAQVFSVHAPSTSDVEWDPKRLTYLDVLAQRVLLLAQIPITKETFPSK